MYTLRNVLESKELLEDAKAKIIRDGLFNYNDRLEYATQKNKNGNYKSVKRSAQVLVKKHPSIRKSIIRWQEQNVTKASAEDCKEFDNQLSIYLCSLMLGQLAQQIVFDIVSNSLPRLNVRLSTEEEDMYYAVDFWIGETPVQVKATADPQDINKQNWKEVFRKRFSNDRYKHIKKRVRNPIYVLIYLEDNGTHISQYKDIVLWHSYQTAEEGHYLPISDMGNSRKSKKEITSYLKNFLNKVSTLDNY